MGVQGMLEEERGRKVCSPAAHMCQVADLPPQQAHACGARQVTKVDMHMGQGMLTDPGMHMGQGMLTEPGMHMGLGLRMATDSISLEPILSLLARICPLFLRHTHLVDTQPRVCGL